ncbi:MAG: peptidase [Desulfobacterales bacterium]|nr:peptidase [Desulfobacterales bacterium]
MIKSFSHKGLEKFFLDGIKKGIQSKHKNRLELILDTLNAAHIIEDMNFPNSGLHLLKPKKEKVWAVKVSGNWRVTFKYEDGDAYFVDYLDYH